jgi:hypothetical protein
VYCNVLMYAHANHTDITSFQDLRGWELSPDQLMTANKRSNDLGGEEHWLPRQLNFITKTFRLKAVDFVRMSKGAMSWVFEGVFDKPESTNQKKAFESFNETLRLLLTTHFNADGNPLSVHMKNMVANLHQQVAQTLSLLEACSPIIFFDRMLHILLHVPMAMAKWNACRNFWAFASERSTINMFLKSCSLYNDTITH